jgi:hypothetical protein
MGTLITYLMELLEEVESLHTINGRSYHWPSNVKE